MFILCLLMSLKGDICGQTHTVTDRRSMKLDPELPDFDYNDLYHAKSQE